MKRLFPLLLLLISCSKEIIPTVEEIDPYADCRPQVTVLDNSKTDAITGLIEFDILPDKNYNSKGAVLTSEDRLWPKNEEGMVVIPYYFEPTTYHANGTMTLGFSNDTEKNIIRSHFKELEEIGLLMKEHLNKEALLAESKDGVYIKPHIGNSANLGRQGGLQPIHLSFSLTKGDVNHEVFHTAGFAHEFTRSDRDEHLIIHWDNMLERYHRQFDVHPDIVDCGPFDIKSLMMYGSYQLYNAEGLPIITTIDGQVFEMSTDLSEGDIATFKAMYNLN